MIKLINDQRYLRIDESDPFWLIKIKHPIFTQQSNFNSKVDDYIKNTANSLNNDGYFNFLYKITLLMILMRSLDCVTILSILFISLDQVFQSVKHNFVVINFVSLFIYSRTIFHFRKRISCSWFGSFGTILILNVMLIVCLTHLFNLPSGRKVKVFQSYYKAIKF